MLDRNPFRRRGIAMCRLKSLATVIAKIVRSDLGHTECPDPVAEYFEVNLRSYSGAEMQMRSHQVLEEKHHDRYRAALVLAATTLGSAPQNSRADETR
ncbi:hypothetical protein [Paraburkholderia sp. JHI869]|uniref:hypothetical protein n=1 Tax=Paraburkholderia sp. JHI869 TaxID=3112959 RepID=UPI0031744373